MAGTGAAGRSSQAAPATASSALAAAIGNQKRARIGGLSAGVADAGKAAAASVSGG